MDKVSSRIYTIEEIIEKLNPIFEINGVIKAILFGSYATGEATENSDIDLVVEVEDWVDSLDFYGIGGDISDCLEKKVDFFDVIDVIKDGRADMEIKQTGRIIYEKVR